MQKRFVSWAAVSSLPQAKKISVDDQLKTNLEHIEKWDGILHKELPIRGKSRSIITWERACASIPEYAALRDMIARREFDVLIYLDRSRLGRKANLIDTIIELCHEAGIVTYATESPPASLESKGSDFAHKIVGAVESLIAQEEVTKMQHRHQMGMAHRVRSGNFPAAIPYGWTVRYEIEDDKPVQILEVDEQAKVALQYILELYLRRGYSVREIGNAMVENGYSPPRSGKWSKAAVGTIINAIWRYAGYVELNRRSEKREYIKAKSRWPALITEEDAKAVIAERRRRFDSKRSAQRVHRFSQVIYCGICGNRMAAAQGHFHSRRDPNEVTRMEVYRCVDSEGFARHPKYNISGRYIEEYLRADIESLKDNATRSAILGPNQSNVAPIEQKIARARKRLEDNEVALQRADDAYVAGSMSGERYQRQVDRLDEQRAKIEAEIARHEAELEAAQFDDNHENRLIEVATMGIAMLDSADIAAANVWFRAHLKVWIHNDSPEYRIRPDYI